MRMWKVAVVLLVLASFVVATTAISTAAAVTPTMKPMATMAKPTMAAMPKATMKATAMPNATMGKPVMPAATMKAPVMQNTTIGKPTMPGMPKVKSDFGGICKKLIDGVRMPGKTMSNSGLGVKYQASKMVSDTFGKIAMSSGSSQQLGLAAPRPVSQLSGLPKVGSTKAKAGEAPGANLMIDLGL